MITKTAVIKLSPSISRIDTISGHYKGMPMNRTLLALFTAALIVLTGCGGGGGGGGGNDSGTAGTKLGLFSEQVKACTPYLNKGSLSTGESNLTDWNSWNPGASNTVLGKLFDPANGKDECIYSKLQVLDSHIQLVNQFSDRWLTSGVYYQGNITATVNTTVSTVTIPFLALDLGILDPLDRLVTLNVPDQNLTIHMAFLQDSGKQTILEQYSIGASESGVFLARVIGNDVEIWCASITESKVQIMWEGNTAEKSFRISACTNASTSDYNWEIIGGGSIASSTSEMAFMARNDSNNSSVDEYYLTITYDGLQNGTAQTILNAGTTPPNPSVSVLTYIIEGNDNSLGFLGIDQYPNTLEDVAWVQ